MYTAKNKYLEKEMIFYYKKKKNHPTVFLLLKMHDNVFIGSLQSFPSSFSETIISDRLISLISNDKKPKVICDNQPHVSL